MVNSYIGDYWGGRCRGYDRILYTLSEPSHVNSKYLLREACIQINEFIAYALELGNRSGEVDTALELSNRSGEVDMDIINNIRRLLQKMLDAAAINSDPRVVLCSIPGILNWMKALAWCFDGEELPPSLSSSTRLLYYVYVLGVVDVCCTMDGGNTKIDQNYNVEPQLYLIDILLKEYPHLLDWVRQSTQDWEEGEEMSYIRKTDPKYSGFESEVWYLTSPRRGSPLHRIDKYHKDGHAHP